MDELLTIEPAMGKSSRKNISTVIGQFGNRLLGFIRSRVNSEEDAEDILQDVWFQFTKALDAGPIEQVSSWLFRVARNRIIDNYRKKKPELLDDLFVPDDEEDALSLQEILFSEKKNPEWDHLRNLFWKTLEEALNELPNEQRMVFVWNELEDIPFKEISERTGEPVNTLISRKRYAVLHLRNRLAHLRNELLNY
ncbi:MAG: RNA polymerase sigma factor [Chitinophagales bacterium]